MTCTWLKERGKITDTFVSSFFLINFIYFILTWIDKHVISPHNIHTFIQQTGYENTQTYQVEFILTSLI